VPNGKQDGERSRRMLARAWPVPFAAGARLVFVEKKLWAAEPAAFGRGRGQVTKRRLDDRQAADGPSSFLVT